jgi:hypothetical protein
MHFISASPRVSESVQSALDRHWREALQMDVAEIPEGVVAQLRVAFESFGCTTLLCVFLQPSVDESAKVYLALQRLPVGVLE